MNTVLESWKRVNSSSASVRMSAQPAAATVAKSPISPPVLFLARQVFSAGNAVKRRRVLFVSADTDTRAFPVGEEVARAVASMQVTVALVDSGMPPPQQTAIKKPAASVRRTDFLAGFQISERLWKIPLPNFLDIDHPVARGVDDPSAPFDCVVFTSVISDSATPLLCSLCDAAVLFLTAGRTRRDVALRAKQLLEQFDVEFLGTVLSGRTFPVPESIYRRL
ncbi:MAG TPA: hypothetical protein VGL74_08840 [Terriglobales bacterium]|jgi:hypothetical protein